MSNEHAPMSYRVIKTWQVDSCCPCAARTFHTFIILLFQLFFRVSYFWTTALCVRVSLSSASSASHRTTQICVNCHAHPADSTLPKYITTQVHRCRCAVCCHRWSWLLLWGTGQGLLFQQQQSLAATWLQSEWSRSLARLWYVRFASTHANTLPNTRAKRRHISCCR